MIQEDVEENLYHRILKAHKKVHNHQINKIR